MSLQHVKITLVHVLERKLVHSIQRHYNDVIDAFDLTDVIDVLVSEECLTPAQHTAVRKTEGHLGIEKVQPQPPFKI